MKINQAKSIIPIIIVTIINNFLIHQALANPFSNCDYPTTQIEYDYVSCLSDGLARVKKDEKYGFINESGEVIIPLNYDYTAGFSHALNLSLVKFNKKWGVIDKKGDIVVPIKYKDVNLPYDEDGLIAVKRAKNKSGYLNLKGEIVVPFKYDASYTFEDGMGLMRRDDKFGYIDHLGKVFIPPDYETLWGFEDGIAVAQVNGKYGYINLSNETVIDFKYDYIAKFSEGLSAVDRKEKTGYIDKTGKQVIPFMYDYGGDFKNGYAVVGNNPNKIKFKNSYANTLAKIMGMKHGLIDKKNNLVMPIKYDSVDILPNGLARVSRDGKKWDKPINPVSLVNE